MSSPGILHQLTAEFYYPFNEVRATHCTCGLITLVRQLRIPDLRFIIIRLKSTVIVIWSIVFSCVVDRRCLIGIAKAAGGELGQT